jgi:hypothetical protein
VRTPALDADGGVRVGADAAEPVAWLRLLALSGPPATAGPKMLRYRLLRVPDRLTRHPPRSGDPENRSAIRPHTLAHCIAGKGVNLSAHGYANR